MSLISDRLYTIYSTVRASMLEEIYTGREKRRGAGRPALRRGNVGMRKYTNRGERQACALYIHGYPKFIRSHDSTRARYVTSIWNVESISPDLCFTAGYVPCRESETSEFLAYVE